MSDFSVVLKNRAGTVELYQAQGFRLSVQRYSSRAIGGPEAATLVVDGVGDALWSVLNWLGYGVEIRNHMGTPVWWGRVWEADVRVNGLRRGCTMEKMYNKIAVAYSVLDVDGQAIYGETGWATDSESSTRYGNRELRYSLGDGEGVAATAKRDWLLSKLANPKAQRREASGEDGATLYCVGLWAALDDAYYSQPAGREQNNVSGNESQSLGWALSGVTTVSFTASNKSIADSGNRLGGLQRNDKIVVSGSGSNNGTFTVDSVNADGAQIRVLETIVDEAAGASVTISAWGVWVAQSFTPATAWNAVTVAVQLAKVGAPGDNVTIELQSDSSGVPSGTILASATLAPGSIGNTAAWKLATLSVAVALSAGATYWIVIKRSGASSATAYFKTQVDTGLAYTGGNLRLRTPGGTWSTRVTDGDLPFRVLDATDTAAQLRTMLGTVSLFAAVDGNVSSGITVNQWRDGQSRCLAEVVKLLEMRTSGGRRLLASVSPDRVASLFVEPVATEYGLTLRRGEFITAAGAALPAGVLPVGAWVNEVDLPQNLDVLVDGPLLFVERAEYDCERRELQWWPRDDDDPLALPGVTQG